MKAASRIELGPEPSNHASPILILRRWTDDGADDNRAPQHGCRPLGARPAVHVDRYHFEGAALLVGRVILAKMKQCVTP
jgi:hypothetical protein